MPEKLKSLLQSRRFWAALAGVLAVSLKETVGLDEEQVLAISAIVATLIWGETQRPMQTREGLGG